MNLRSTPLSIQEGRISRILSSLPLYRINILFVHEIHIRALPLNPPVAPGVVRDYHHFAISDTHPSIMLDQRM